MNIRESEIPVDIYKRRGGSSLNLTIPAIQNKNLPQWSYKAIYFKLNEAYNDKSRSLLILGGAGIGKSQLVAQFAGKAAKLENRDLLSLTSIHDKKREEVIANPEKYYVFLDLRAGELNPEQAQGIPDVEWGKGKGYLRFLPPDWVALISNPQFSGLVFLDELNRGTESVVNSLFQLVLDRVASGRKVSDKVMIVAASNLGTGGEFSGTSTIDSALMSRFSAGVLMADLPGWVKHAKELGVSKYIIDFAEANPEDNFFAKGQEIADHNIPINPRQLVAASNHLKAVEKSYLEAEQGNGKLPEQYTGNIYNDIATAISGDVGTKWTNAFIEWLGIVHAFEWVDLLRRAKLPVKDPLHLTAMKQDKSWALVRYITDEILRAFEKARQNKASAEMKKIVEEFYTILGGLSADQVGFLLKKIADEIRNNRIEGITQVRANEDWRDLVVGMFDIAKTKKNDALMDRVRMITDELSKVNVES